MDDVYHVMHDAENLTISSVSTSTGKALKALQEIGQQ